MVEARMRPILLSDNLISRAAQRGISRYFDKIVDAAIAEFGHDAIICSPQGRDYGAAQHIRSVRLRGSWRIGLQDRLASLVASVKRPCVVYNVYYGDMHAKAAHVFTVYDMIHEMIEPPSHPFIAHKRRCLRRASAVLAISENTAKDIRAIYPDIQAKIVVTQLGVDESFFTDNRLATPPSTKPYFLYVGLRTPYKNYMRLLEAFGESGLAKEFDLRVISPGGGAHSQQEIDCIDRYHMRANVLPILSPSDDILRQSYRQAHAFIYPSLYEGFGLPILEAMASGTLVATSNTSSMPEIGGDVALYFDPLSVESIAECLRQLINVTSEQRSRRIEQGIARARTFTWQRCQQQTMEVLRNLASQAL
jgi:glycosyltransferase involved in cell wall biosynthesis